jgi:hypothetical protein
LGRRKQVRDLQPPGKWSDTGCLTTMPSGRWMFSVLSGSSNARSWADAYFPNSHVRMPAFRLFWKERKCSPLLTSFCPLIPTKCILCFTHQHYPYVTCSQLLAHNQVLRQGGRKNVSNRFWSHKTQAHTSLCQEPFTQSQFFRRLGVLETQARSRPTSKIG